LAGRHVSDACDVWRAHKTAGADCNSLSAPVPIGTNRYWWVLAAPIGPDIPIGA
jgi:hypothetical protein